MKKAGDCRRDSPTVRLVPIGVNSFLEGPLCCAALMSALGYMIREAMDRLDITQEQLAERLGVQQSFVSKVIRAAPQTKTGTPHKVPVEDAGRWADALGLQGDERARFVELVWFSHSPAAIEHLVEGLRRKLAKSEEQHRLLVQELIRLGVQLPKGVQ